MRLKIYELDERSQDLKLREKQLRKAEAEHKRYEQQLKETRVYKANHSDLSFVTYNLF